MKNSEIALSTAEILLPKDGLFYDRFATIACDQFTAEPEYWREVEEFVGDNPSALRLTLPEVFLSERKARIPAIHAAMRTYIANAVKVAVPDGFVLVQRETSCGTRPGLVCAIDLEMYDFSSDAQSLIRATEGTVTERVPPRAEIRAGAPMELPHVMMLLDDPKMTVIEPLFAKRDALRPLYDFDLMLGGGHIRGWAVEKADALGVFSALSALHKTCKGLLYAVGDGNHSLAAAKKCWDDIKGSLTPAKREISPARYALVEVVNLHCPSLVFEPIHRMLFNVSPADVFEEFSAWAPQNGFSAGGDALCVAVPGREISFGFSKYPVETLQSFLDAYLAGHPAAEIDYIHGSDALEKLLSRGNAIGFSPRAFDKKALFPYIRERGALPRKTFSMGEARDKRYYLEMRRIGQ